MAGAGGGRGPYGGPASLGLVSPRLSPPVVPPSPMWCLAVARTDVRPSSDTFDSRSATRAGTLSDGPGRVSRRTVHAVAVASAGPAVCRGAVRRQAGRPAV
ncbi:hypothetical protein Pve01_59750 [Planomonospora venezuelensis]|nr:hypothetical protein Pve01_59750 [Planomonospora venezuelensis]